MTVWSDKANGVSVEYVIFPDEGHGSVKNENNITASKRALEFMDKYLKGDGEVESE